MICSNKISFTLFNLLILWPFLLSGQEVRFDLEGNAAAKEYYLQSSDQRKNGPADTLSLPFIEDFSDAYVRPDPGRWSDQFAFINNKYPVYPLTAGVATLDALNSDGSHYPQAGKNPYVADRLTSKPIHLNYPAADSIYFSFYYQAKGLGEQPDDQDSLCLDFFDPLIAQWLRVWSVPGDALRPFKRVMLPVTDSRFLQKGFRFRFLNIASQSENNDYPDRKTNVDHWHIDYIELDRNRFLYDTVQRDVGFIDPVRSILKDYENIPWKHFANAYNTQRNAFIKVVFQNHDTIIRNVTKELQIRDVRNSFLYKPVATANDVAPGDSVHFLYGFDYPFDFNTGDSGLFEITTILRTDAFDYKANDTLRHLQVFDNYYAYDDGTAEAGYGIRGQGSKDGSVAVKFNSFIPDTLRAVDMYFNHILDSLNLNYYFYLDVWSDNNGKPGTLLYSQDGMKPAYSGNLNTFTRYHLEQPVAVNGTFYIGWTNTQEYLLNIGMDLNRNSSSRNFYNLGQGWENSSFPASLMMRPVVSRNQLVNRAYVNGSDSWMVKIYPNPASDLLNIKPTRQEEAGLQGSITDLNGRIIRTFTLHEMITLNLEMLPPGFYFIVFEGRMSKEVHKLVIRR
jgi:hypothetical protein